MENGGSWQVSSHDPGLGPLQGRSTNPQRFPAAKELGPGGAGKILQRKAQVRTEEGGGTCVDRGSDWREDGGGGGE